MNLTELLKQKERYKNEVINAKDSRDGYAYKDDRMYARHYLNQTRQSIKECLGEPIKQEIFTSPANMLYHQICVPNGHLFDELTTRIFVRISNTLYSETLRNI